MRPLGACADAVAENLAKQSDLVAGALFPRFNGMFEQALYAAGCMPNDLPQETTRCMIELQNLVGADPTAGCLPELMWKAAATNWPIEDDGVSIRMRQRFHLLALIYELPSSDERGALREYVFGTKAGSADKYSNPSQQARDDVNAGMEMLAAYLYKERTKVEFLTAGAISATQLLTLDDAFDLVMANIGVNKRKTRQ